MNHENTPNDITNDSCISHTITRNTTTTNPGVCVITIDNTIVEAIAHYMAHAR